MIFKRLRLWVIKKLKAIPEEKQIEIPKQRIACYETIRPDTLRVVRRLTDSEMYQMHDENTRSWMTECIIKDLKRRVVDEIFASGAIRIRHCEETGEYEASVLVVRDVNRPGWM